MATTIKLETVYSDGSGAPAVVVVDGFMFSADYLGDVKLTAHSGSRKPTKRAVAVARCAYERELRARADARWFAANAVMYA